MGGPRNNHDEEKLSTLIDLINQGQSLAEARRSLALEGEEWSELLAAVRLVRDSARPPLPADFSRQMAVDLVERLQPTAASIAGETVNSYSERNGQGRDMGRGATAITRGSLPSRKWRLAGLAAAAAILFVWGGMRTGLLENWWLVAGQYQTVELQQESMSEARSASPLAEAVPERLEKSAHEAIGGQGYAAGSEQGAISADRELLSPPPPPAERAEDRGEDSATASAGIAAAVVPDADIVDIRGIIAEVTPRVVGATKGEGGQTLDPDAPVSSEEDMQRDELPRDVIGYLLVDGMGEEGIRHQQGRIAVTGSTAIVRQEDGTRVPAGFNGLQAGLKVEVTFTGPVAESYPVQAQAAEIIILSKGGS